MSLADNILNLTEQLYDAAAEPAQWPTAMESMVNAFGAAHGTLNIFDPARMSDSSLIGARFDLQDLARFRAMAIQNLAPLFAIPQGIMLRTSIISDEDFERSEAYNEFLRPIGGFYSLHLNSDVAGRTALLSLCRGQGAENFSFDETAALRMVAPHIKTAVAMQYRLQTAELHHAGLAHLIDRLAVGAILVDGAGKPVLINSRAQQIVDENDGIVLDTNRLAAATPLATRRLREAIGAAGGPQAIEQRLLLERTSRRAPLRLTVLPVWRLAAALPGVAAPRVAIVIDEPDALRPIDRMAFAESYRLTGRESEVALMIGDGLNLSTIASRLGLEVGSVRQYVKRVFAKTDTRSQAALASLLRGFTDLTH